jgi:hypothetical protein
MKKLAFWALALTVLFVAVPAMAQQDQMTEEEIIELVRSNIQKDKVAIIGAAMNFSADEAGEFWPIYKGYEAELAKVSDQRVALIKDFAANYMTMTDAKAKELGETAMGIEKQRMKLKHDCFEKLAAEMSPVIATRFLQVENQLNMLLDLQLAQQLPLIEKP